ncbi:ABC transporter ATP-binding protein [Helcococcus kunzii]|uniref:ABC transporter ATP-binding protein n=1 Tax=Helcococcus kunzii TaxID=40091 RepID=UPI0024AE6F1F|nr:putative bacteriocin export ABC transporter [Helcococcus kunzii]
MIIKAINLSKKFGNKILFTDFSINVKHGESIIIIGHSGSGKSTLLNILSLIESPDSGKIFWKDEQIIKIGNSKINKIIRKDIGYLFQNYALLDNKSVYENIEIACKYKKYKTKDEKVKDINNALDRVGLKDFQDRKIYSLSGGEQQRVALARLIVKPCEIIFADEPTGNLDLDNSKKIMDLLFELNKEGKTIVVVTHDRNIIDRFDTVINLDKL